MSRTETKNRYKVCLIVDNPLRDLDGLVLLAWHLANRDAEVYLVPMYYKEEVLHIKPDLVLVNYARSANQDFLKHCSDGGILVGVLDTEGGVILNWTIYLDNAAKYVEHVDFYCLWGRKQYEALSGNAAFAGLTLKTTGCPRYDYCVPPWNEAQPKNKIDRDKMVLINTNFPIAMPRYNSSEKEVRELIANGYEEKYARDLLTQNRSALGEVVKTVKHIAPKFPSVTFVVRPHPFENDDIYKKEFGNFENVEVHREGPVFPWIKRSIILLHYNCSTAFDAVMQNVEPVYLDWINLPLLKQEASYRVSRSAGSLQELEEMLNGLINDGKLQVDESKKNVRKKLIRDYFYEADGKCSERVSDIIIEILDKKKREKIPVKGGGIRKIIVDLLKKQKWKNLTRNIILYMVGSRNYQKIKALVLSRGKTGKEFNVEDVRLILERITSAVGVNATYDLENPVDGNSKITFKGALFSVRISRHNEAAI